MDMIELPIGTEILINGKKHVVRKKEECQMKRGCNYCGHDRVIAFNLAMRKEIRKDRMCVYFAPKELF